MGVWLGAVSTSPAVRFTSAKRGGFCHCNVFQWELRDLETLWTWVLVRSQLRSSPRSTQPLKVRSFPRGEPGLIPVSSVS